MNDSQVTHLSGWSNYTRVHQCDGSVVLKAITIGKLLERDEYHSFIRIHRHFAINPLHVTGQVFQGIHLVEVEFIGFNLPVARRRSVVIKNTLSSTSNLCKTTSSKFSSRAA